MLNDKIDLCSSQVNSERTFIASNSNIGSKSYLEMKPLNDD